MTTNPIAAARALIEPLTEYTPGPWEGAIYDDVGFINVPLSGYDGDFMPGDARLIAAAPDLRDMVATLADALEAERAKVAAAYEAAAYRARVHREPSLGGMYWDGVNKASRIIEDSIRALTPSDAQAAIDKMLAEARLEGWRAGRDAATEPLTSLAAVLRESEISYHQPQASALLERVDAIRALPEPKEASHEPS